MREPEVQIEKSGLQIFWGKETAMLKRMALIL